MVAGVCAVAGGAAGGAEGLATGAGVSAGAGVAEGAGDGVAGPLAAGGAGAAEGLTAGAGDCASAALPQANSANGISAIMPTRREFMTFIPIVPMGRADEHFAALRIRPGKTPITGKH